MFVTGCEERRLVGVVSEEKKDALLRSLDMDRFSLERDVAAIRIWLDKQPHLPPIDSDELIKAYILGCKGSLEKTKRKLDAYYAIRNVFPEIFHDRDTCSTNFQYFTNANPVVTLPRLTEDGCRVHVFWVSGPDPSDFDCISAIKNFVSILDIYTRTEPFITGDYVVISCTHANMGHLTKITPTHIKSTFLITEKIFAMRLKGVYYINAPPVIDILVNKIARPFITKKAADRITVTTEDHHFLHKHFNKEILPKDFGGDEVDLNTLKDMWLHKLMEKRDWFMAESKLVTNEKLRPKESRRDDLFGLDGTFRQLTID